MLVLTLTPLGIAGACSEPSLSPRGGENDGGSDSTVRGTDAAIDDASVADSANPADSSEPLPSGLARFVNPIIGTKGGETWPGADLPFGMLQFSPETTRGNQTRTPAPGGYAHSAMKIRGFSLTHLSGTGCAGAFGDIPFFPYAGTVSTSPTADTTDKIYASTFLRPNEQAIAGYYGVTLDSKVRAELTATMRTGSARFTYPADKPATLLIRASNSELGSTEAHVSIDAASRTITGSVTSGNFCGYIYGEAGNVDRRSYYTVYFHAEFDRPITATGSWADNVVKPGSTESNGGTTYGKDGFPPAGKGSGAYAVFDTGGQPVNMRVGISFVSAANAKANLEAENPQGTTFETVKQKAWEAWNEKLDRVQVTGGTDDQRTTFYTSVYHSLLHPNVFNDVNGEYVGMDQKVHKLSPGQNAQYANFSGWDVYRGQLQLVTLLEPTIGGDIAQSLLNQADQNKGVWDRWTHAQGGTHVMTGDPGHAAVPAIYAFGGTNFDAKGALASMVHAATTVTEEDKSKDGWNVMVVGERPSLDKYLTIHYVPAFGSDPKEGNAWGGASETLEDVVADFGVAQLAARLGENATHDEFLRRSGYWRNVFNPAAHSSGGYIQDRRYDGTWVTPFTPNTEDGFAEGSSAQYTLMVQHDVHGLFEAMGGNEKATARLDRFFHFDNGLWALTGAGGEHAEINNEPSVAAAWMYNFLGAPYKTQDTVREIINEHWKNSEIGIPGQDDLGAMSAWYAWSALGVYPQYIGRSELLLGTPLFTKAVIRTSKGRTLTINAPGATANTRYVQSVSVNGQPSTRAWVPESFLAGDGTLDFTVSTQPNKEWGAAPGDTPPSFPPAP
ncbi:GH92 family glycosyl hydrolase [Pendulispora rubella]|uniref:GH92 family glycosyl hydrolase n=1 Tax=Pendulispora rubella TaxID=2741070 RepID=A0ABZ2L8U4_9BACT